jgi:hypothetical protein
MNKWNFMLLVPEVKSIDIFSIVSTFQHTFKLPWAFGLEFSM